MSENNDHDARKPRISTPDPAGDVRAPYALPVTMEMPEQRTRAAWAAGQPNVFPEDQDAVPGRPDGDTDGGARRA